MARSAAVLHRSSLLRVIVIVCLLAGVARADESRVEIGYHKGRALKLRLVTIGWTEVEIATARAYRQMEAAAEADGIALGIRSGFRSHERQLWLYEAYRGGWGNLAAKPGYSNHQAGRALDLYIDDPQTLAWLGTHARRFGFRQTVRGEPWHFEYTPVRRAVARRTATRRR